MENVYFFREVERLNKYFFNRYPLPFSGNQLRTFRNVSCQRKDLLWDFIICSLYLRMHLAGNCDAVLSVILCLGCNYCETIHFGRDFEPRHSHTNTNTHTHTHTHIHTNRHTHTHTQAIARVSCSV